MLWTCLVQFGASSDSVQGQHADQAAVRGPQGQRARSHDGLLLPLKGHSFLPSALTHVEPLLIYSGAAHVGNIIASVMHTCCTYPLLDLVVTYCDRHDFGALKSAP